MVRREEGGIFKYFFIFFQQKLVRKKYVSFLAKKWQGVGKLAYLNIFKVLSTKAQKYFREIISCF